MKSLAPGFLIATPQLADGHFQQAVVLMVEHTAAGAMGLVINQPASVTFEALAESQSLEVALNRAQDPLFKGGPVEPYRGFVLHDSDSVAERNEIVPGLYLSVTADALSELVKDPFATVRFCLGYAGWGAGQIEAELKEGSWLFTEASCDDVLHTAPGKVWEQVLKSMGIDPGWVMPPGGVN